MSWEPWGWFDDVDSVRMWKWTGRSDIFLCTNDEAVKATVAHALRGPAEHLGYASRSKAAAKFIRDYIVINDRSPSISEIQKAVGYRGRRSTMAMLDRMEADGLITRGAEGLVRTIRVKDMVDPT